MRVGIVGAGMAGLAAGRTLVQRGHQVVIFERSKGLGGRVATRRIGPYIFDTGASGISPRGMSIEQAMLHELDASDLVQIEKPIFTHQFLRVTSGDISRAKVPRYTYRSGNTKLAKLLAEGMEVRLETQVDELGKRGDGYTVLGEDFDALILTPPVPHALTLLWSIGENRPLNNSSYRSCLSVLLGFEKPLTTQYYALLDPEQMHPLTWLSIENEKCSGRAPEGHTAMVAQLNGPYSLSHFSAENSAVVDLVVDYLTRLYGPGWDTPVVFDVKRWRYSQPEGIASFESVNRPGSTLLLAGDGVLGGRAEQAYESGVKAANLLLSTVALAGS